MDFYDRIKYCCEQKEITLSEMVKTLELSTGMPTKWKNGLIPNGETLIKIANYLNESIDYLLGREQKNKVIAYSGDDPLKKDIENQINYIFENLDNDLQLSQIKMFLDTYVKK